MGRILRWGFLGLAVVLVALTAIGFVVPQPKCGDVGYYAKLTPVCSSAQGHATSERYCSVHEVAEVGCAAATTADEDGRF